MSVKKINITMALVLSLLLAVSFIPAEVFAGETDSSEEVKMVLPEGMNFDDKETEKKPKECKMCGYRKAKSGSFIQHEHRGILFTDENGEYRDYYQCEICNQYFEDQECTKPITLDIEEWKTGETSEAENVSLVKTERKIKTEVTVTVILILAVGVITGAVLIKRKKKI